MAALQAVRNNDATVQALVLAQPANSAMFAGFGNSQSVATQSSSAVGSGTVGTSTDGTSGATQTLPATDASSPTDLTVNGGTAAAEVIPNATIFGKDYYGLTAPQTAAVSVGLVGGFFQSIGDNTLAAGGLLKDGLLLQNYLLGGFADDSSLLYGPEHEAVQNIANLGKAVVQLALNPIDTVTAISSSTYSNIAAKYETAVNTQDLSDYFSFGAAVGHTVTDVASAFLGLAGAAKAGAGLAVEGFSAITDAVKARLAAQAALEATETVEISGDAIAPKASPGATAATCESGKYVGLPTRTNLEVYGTDITRTTADIPALLAKAGIAAEDLEGFRIVQLTQEDYDSRVARMASVDPSAAAGFNGSYGPSIVNDSSVYTFKNDIQSTIGGVQQAPIYLNPNIMGSDELIVQTVAHEMSEINALQYAGEPAGTFTGAQYNKLISPSVNGNLHFNAVNEGDPALVQFRAQSGS